LTFDSEEKSPMKYLTSIILFFCFSIVIGQHVYEIDTRYPVHDLQSDLVIIEDTNNSFTPEVILNNNTLKGIDQKARVGRLDVGITYWGKITLKTNKPLENWTLHFEDKMIGPPAWTKSNGKIDVYAYANNQFLFHKKTGVEYAKSEREVKKHWVLNQVSLGDIPVNTEVTLIIKAQGNSIGYPAYFNMSARHPSQANYHQIYQFNNSFNIFMFGVTFIIFLYHLLQYFYLREKVMLWFSVWLLFIMLTHAMTVGLILGSFTKLRFTIYAITANGVFYTFWFFGRAFINSKEKFPKLDKIMIGLSLFVLIESIAVALYVPIFNAQPYYTGIGIHYTVLNIYTALSLILSVILVFQKDKFAKYFGVGSIIATSFLFIGTLWSMGVIKPTTKFIDPYATGMFLQIIIYSFGIAYRRQVINNQVQQDKLEAQQTYAEMQRIKDLDEVKTRFFANISHEFRTPLSLIKGPLNRAKKESTSNEITLNEKAFDIINSNTNRLQGLIDQLLDLSKLENGSVHLSLKQGGIIKLLRSLVFSFESMAERKNIGLNTQFPSEIDNALYDKDKLEKIVSNLLSNAFKYTPNNGTVTVIINYKNDAITIEISDTGKGINKDELKRVFDRFYRVEGSEAKGSGIGLSLVKELVDLHNGKLNVDSIIGQGTTFKITLPISLEALPSNQVLIESPQNEVTIKVPLINETETNYISENTEINNREVALIIEDNEDLRYFISDIIKEQYQILTAENGLQGERMAFEHIPDIVISDIMMPKKDGYELCHSLKANPKTSHIPIIMLTAKAGQESKIEGLTQGADAYITKPFDEKELMLRMKNLIESRKKIWEHFKALDMLLVDDIEVNSIDDKFLQDVFTCIKHNLDNEQFSVEDIARNVGFSRSQLHRKLKALSDRSANQLIVEVRLNEAHRLLKQKAGSVSEIAYTVGYSNLSYFTKSFKEKFGTLPSKV
jgi:signal transduction histidine kinase/DNA-binding response OmpR family regulator